MADTQITNSPGTNDSGAAGWFVAFIVLIAIIVGGVVLYRNGTFRSSAPADTTNINVTLPNPITPDTTTP